MKSQQEDGPQTSIFIHSEKIALQFREKNSSYVERVILEAKGNVEVKATFLLIL